LTKVDYNYLAIRAKRGLIYNVAFYTMYPSSTQQTNNINQ